MRRAAWRLEVQRKGAEDLALRVKDRRRPARPQAMRQREPAVVLPQRVGGNILDNDRLPPKGRGTARTSARTNPLTVDAAKETVWQAGRRAVMDMHAVCIEQEYRAQHAGRLPLDHA